MFNNLKLSTCHTSEFCSARRLFNSYCKWSIFTNCILHFICESQYTLYNIHHIIKSSK